MLNRLLPFIFLFILPSILTGTNNDLGEQRMDVIMRTIGHEILLLSKDSTSRILPIENKGNRYIIKFEKEFEFEPQQIINTIHDITNQSDLIDNYLVEIVACESQEIVHSYEIDEVNAKDWLPCSQRAYPKACYHLWMTIIEGKKHAIITDAPKSSYLDEKSNSGYYIFGLLMIPFLIFIGRRIYDKKTSESYPTNPNIIPIGQYRFDKRNMKLTFHEISTELTGKEADLLLLLFNSANITLEREQILKNVWGDEGDYVGRTLDVFISKLRKKISADPNLKIINIRGKGYKFVVND